MPDNKPPTPPRSRAIPKSYFYARDLATGDETSRPRYSRVWNTKGLKFTMNFKVLYSLYWQRYGLISYDQINLYNYLVYLGEEGMAFSNRNLAKLLGFRSNTITAHLFHLEDIELLYRVRILDLPGRPLDVVNQTPYTPARLEREAPRLKQQVAEQMTAGRWAQLGQKFPGPERSYNWKKVMERIGNKQAARVLDQFVSDIIFRHRGQELSRQTFHNELTRVLIANGIVKTKDIVAAAFDLKARYQG